MGGNKEKTIKLKDIALEANTSIATVSKVLNNTQGAVIGSKTRALILGIAKKLNYRPCRGARFFAGGKTGAVAVIFPNEIFTDYIWRATATLSFDIYREVADYFSEHDYLTTLLFSPEDNASAFLKEKLLRERVVDGVIIFAGLEELELSREFEENGISCVSFDWRSPAYDVDHIDEDPHRGIARAVEELVRLQHKNAGCVFFKNDAKAKHVLRRRDCFLDECKKQGLNVAPEHLVEAMDETDSYLKTRSLFQQGEYPSAVFYTSDHFAMQGIRALLDLDLRVHEDVSVIGCDDAPFNSSSLVPLASIRISRRAQARAGAELLMRKINNNETSKGFSSTVIIHSELILRESLGPRKIIHDAREEQL